MMQPDKDHRHTRALEPEIVDENAERELLEVRNHLKQYDSAIKIVQSALERGAFKLRPSTILAIHRDGYSGLSAFAGAYRPGAALIEGSQFEPPAPWLIAELVEDMCDYVNERWSHTTAVHLAAYVMWRLNWIHPFVEGNGSTARLLSYVVLAIRWGGILPGTPTIPEQIAADREVYFEALEYSDRAWRSGQVDVSRMEELITSLLVRQLSGVKS